jgi:hypothetical protein
VVTGAGRVDILGRGVIRSVGMERIPLERSFLRNGTGAAADNALKGTASTSLVYGSHMGCVHAAILRTGPARAPPTWAALSPAHGPDSGKS